ncbi:MAG: LysM peptidoglycan-binding domain-containing protein [Flavobacteriales bacterium]|nr:LysM peptidoglycan-binding domain-containing protein [Flavobacteriales bacterium]
MRYFISLVLILALNGLFAQSGVVAKRLHSISSTIEMTHNGYVQSSIDQLKSSKQTSEEILGKSKLYLPAIEDSLEKHGLPVQLQYLIPALSQYDNWKVSDDGGSGYWQMRYLTAKRYGLNISSYIDERRDYLKATSAAIPYLKYLYQQFGDWHAVIAAFVSDETEITKAIRVSGGQTNYWEYHRYLPLKYQSTLPDFIAMVYLHSYYADLNFTPHPTAKIELDEVTVDKWLTVYQLSKALEINYDSLKDFNAVYKKQVIPDTDKTYTIKIPSNKVARFFELGDSIYGFYSHDTAPVHEPVKVAKVEEPKVQEPKAQEPQVAEPEKPKTEEKRLLYYTIRSGDYLGKIADMYDCNVSDLRKWNNISGDKINAGQKLKIYKPSSEYATYNKINTMTSSQQNALINKD